MQTITANGARCTHGLKAGNCNACPATRCPDTNEWTWTATGKGRTRVIGGRTFKVNRHGVIGMVGDRLGGFDPFYHWGSHGVVADDAAGDELRRAVERAMDHAGVKATCGPKGPNGPTGYCSCAPRF